MEAEILKGKSEDKVKSYVSKIKGIDTSKLGPLIAVGGEHVVLEYDKDRVIKLPMVLSEIHPLYRLLILYNARTQGRKKVEKLSQDMEIGRKYLERFMLPYVIHSSSNGYGRYCIVQRRLGKYEILRPDNVFLVEDQMYQFLHNVRSLILSRNMLVDIMGIEGTFAQLSRTTPCLSNLVIEYSGSELSPRLLLTEVTLIKLSQSNWKEIIDTSVLPYWSLNIMMRILRKDFGLYL